MWSPKFRPCPSRSQFDGIYPWRSLLNLSDSANAYTLAASGGEKLPFDNSGNGASLVQPVTTASDVISAPLMLADNLSINNSSTLTLSGIISNGGAGKSITKAGAGTLVLSVTNNYTGSTTLSAGTLSFNTIGNVDTAGSALGAPSTADAGTINVSGILLYTPITISASAALDVAGRTDQALTLNRLG